MGRPVLLSPSQGSLIMIHSTLLSLSRKGVWYVDIPYNESPYTRQTVSGIHHNESPYITQPVSGRERMNIPYDDPPNTTQLVPGIPYNEPSCTTQPVRRIL